MKKVNNYLWGILLIAIGVCWAGNTIWGWDFNIWSWWPLLILVPCLGSLITEGPKVGNLIGIVLGFIFLPYVRDIINFSIVKGLIIPGVLVVIGLSIIFRDSWRKKFQPKNININIGVDGNGPSERNTYEYNATFSSQNVAYPNNIFSGADVNAVFGSVVLDLRNAIITEDVVINCSAVFGGVEMLVPPNVNLKVSSTPIFGGVSNKNHNMADPNAPIVYVNATCLFGGVEIK